MEVPFNIFLLTKLRSVCFVYERRYRFLRHLRPETDFDYFSQIGNGWCPFQPTRNDFEGLKETREYGKTFLVLK